MKKLFLYLGFLFFAVSASAQGYQPGQLVQSFSATEFGTGKAFSLDDVKETALVLVFTDFVCPYTKLYTDRLASLAKTFGGKGVKFVLINTGKSAPVGLPATVLVLADADQKIAHLLGATKTPEVFVIQPQNGKHTLRYKGGIDDNPQAEKYAKDFYLKNALEAVLTNQSLKNNTNRATGCLIK